MRLFRVKQGVLELVRDELLLVAEFRKVISFVKGETDMFLNITPEMVFTYIYFYCDYTSPYIGKQDEERHLKAVYEAQLPTNWYPNDIVNDAIDKYIELRETGTIKTLKAFNKTLDLMAEVVDTTSNRLRIALKRLSQIDLESITDPEELQKYSTNFAMIKTDLSYLLKVQPDIEKSIKVNYNLLQQAIKDDFEDKKAAGERNIGNRADPKPRQQNRPTIKPAEVPIRDKPNVMHMQRDEKGDIEIISTTDILDFT